MKIWCQDDQEPKLFTLSIIYYETVSKWLHWTSRSEEKLSAFERENSQDSDELKSLLWLILINTVKAGKVIDRFIDLDAQSMNLIEFLSEWLELDDNSEFLFKFREFRLMALAVNHVLLKVE